MIAINIGELYQMMKARDTNGPLKLTLTNENDNTLTFANKNTL